MANPIKSALPLVALGGLLFLTASPAKKRKPKTPIIEKENQFGLDIKDSEILIVSWDKWMAWAPSAIQDAVHDGAQNSIQILSHVLRRVFPHKQWPPLQSDPIVKSWRTLIFNIDRLFEERAKEVIAEPEIEEELDNVIPLRR